jgi:hypothetical protein
VQTEGKKRAAHLALQDRILNGEGRASPVQRARAFSNAGLSQPLDGLLGKSRYETEAGHGRGFRGSIAAGFSEGELFELVICAAARSPEPGPGITGAADESGAGRASIRRQRLRADLEPCRPLTAGWSDG